MSRIAQQKRYCVLLGERERENAISHTSVVTLHNFWRLGWEVLVHSPYSPDMVHVLAQTPRPTVPIHGLRPWGACANVSVKWSI
ncbi:hypothetical protein TNCV_548301 [Trichonephila clavipes]|nr:hypothetical protein TNCV_548301 [Trichonephila clavipes]